MDTRPDLPEPPALDAMLDERALALFLDFDGTLVALAPGPDRIEPRADLAARLSALSERLGGRCAVVSGRGIADIEKHVGPLAVAVAGSHGSDMRQAGGESLGDGPQDLPEAIERQMRDYAADHGIDYEEKPHGGALHYRSKPEAGEGADAFAERLAGEHGWAAQGGKSVVEIVAASANKGAAVRAFMQEQPFAGSLPVFVGDDLTDEAGFAACEELGGFGVLVGTRDGSAARHGLRDVEAVHQWLGL